MLDLSQLIQQKNILLAVFGGAAVASFAVWVMSRRKRQKTEYELVGEVTALHCYPVKSLTGISHNVGFCTFSGIRTMNAVDRQFVIVRHNGDFITQRQVPRMVAIKTKCEGDYLHFQADGMPDIKVPLNPKEDKAAIRSCRVWQDQTLAQDCGEEISQWLSEFLQETSLRLLVVTPVIKNRSCKVNSATGKDTLLFQDEGPYLLATEESLADLLEKIDSPAREEINMSNFRPNIVIRCSKGPWDEDNWSHILIGKNLKMRVLAPMGRCVLTTVNSKTLKRREDGEPLKTLRRLPTFAVCGLGERPHQPMVRWHEG
ncbi:mitochondrial amidoxime-reducing component 1-like [Plakobranchus ocellatus]|uniref:Mitochondrial amidoxime-reducing component 1-like n=1 Tax=Plakobranchus ocellatus TaxID=259542 RepID=A0AAV4AZZ5_9GAST|nr:mitochondrial amidoxime-reducing component 1-like [Plakobranchus ocellatus]